MAMVGLGRGHARASETTMSKQCSITAARNSLTALVHQVEKGPPVELTRRGRPVAVLLSVARRPVFRSVDPAPEPKSWRGCPSLSTHGGCP